MQGKFFSWLAVLAVLVVMLGARPSFASLQEAVIDAVENTEGSASQADEEDSVLLSMRNKLEANLNAQAAVEAEAKWYIEEGAKAECCAAAFNLCEKAPNTTSGKPAKSVLNAARMKCKAVWTVPMKSAQQICSFYNNVVNCAFTPNTEADWDLYDSKLKDCCDSSKTYCASKTASDLYSAKRDCMGYALRSEDELCMHAGSKECEA
jgi:hypothetical protein